MFFFGSDFRNPNYLEIKKNLISKFLAPISKISQLETFKHSEVLFNFTFSQLPWFWFCLIFEYCDWMSSGGGLGTGFPLSSSTACECIAAFVPSLAEPTGISADFEDCAFWLFGCAGFCILSVEDSFSPGCEGRARELTINRSGPDANSGTEKSKIQLIWIWSRKN